MNLESTQANIWYNNIKKKKICTPLIENQQQKGKKNGV